MGEVTKPLYFGGSSRFIAPNGDLYYAVSMLEETTIYKSINNKMEVVEVIPDSGGRNEVLAIDSNGTVAYSKGSSFSIYGLEALDTVSDYIAAAPLEQGGFAVATENGIVLISGDGQITDSFEIGKVTNVATGANGRIAYNLMTTDEFGLSKHEVRSYDPSTGKHLLWATSSTTIIH